MFLCFFLYFKKLQFFIFRQIFVSFTNILSLFSFLFFSSDILDLRYLKCLLIQVNYLQLKKEQYFLVLFLLNYLTKNQKIQQINLFQIFELYQFLYLLTNYLQICFLYQIFVFLLEIIHVTIIHIQRFSYLILILFLS